MQDGLDDFMCRGESKSTAEGLVVKWRLHNIILGIRKIRPGGVPLSREGCRAGIQKNFDSCSKQPRNEGNELVTGRYEDVANGFEFFAYNAQFQPMEWGETGIPAKYDVKEPIG